MSWVGVSQEEKGEEEERKANRVRRTQTRKTEGEEGGENGLQMVKNLSASNAGDLGSIPASRRSPGEGKGDLLQYSCLENLMGRGMWWAMGYSPWGHKEWDRTKHTQGGGKGGEKKE